MYIARVPSTLKKKQSRCCLLEQKENLHSTCRLSRRSCGKHQSSLGVFFYLLMLWCEKHPRFLSSPNAISSSLVWLLPTTLLHSASPKENDGDTVPSLAHRKRSMRCWVHHSHRLLSIEGGCCQWEPRSAPPHSRGSPCHPNRPTGRSPGCHAAIHGPL